MKLPFVPRTRYNDALAEANRQRARAETAENNTATARFKREQALNQLAEADAANRRLHTRNLELGRRVSKLTEPDYVAQLEAAVQAEKKRADHLQRRLDDAVGLTTDRIKDSSPWQPGYEPKAGTV